jgi:hypothetical protein
MAQTNIIETRDPMLASKEMGLMMGVEIEVPITPDEVEKGIEKGKPSDGFDVTDQTLHEPFEGGSVNSELICCDYFGGRDYGADTREHGIEARTPDGGIHYRAIGDWYEAAWNELEERFGPIEPTGYYGGGTAGLHTHVSPITEEQANALYEFSKTAHAKVFCCTSVARDDCDVLRPGHCDFPEERDEYHDCCVNKHRSGGEGHYEWRLPEPMYPDHFRLLVEFIARFMRDTSDGMEFARRLVMDGDERITSIRRARKCGISDVPADNEAARLLKTVA